jgi:hypothetical protein
MTRWNGWGGAVLLAVCSAAATASPRWLEGEVRHDLDGNGVADAGEPGLAGIKVSNGREVVRTDADGHYRLALEDGDTVFVIPAPGYQPPTGPDGLPRFWQHELARADAGLRYGGRPAARADGRFLLRRVDRQPPRLLVFGDPQPRTAAEVEHFRRDIVEPIRGRHAAALGITLGDVVDDDLSLFPGMVAATAAMGLPWLHVPGNHDIDFDAATDEGSLATYRRHLGPDTFAWETADFVVVGLDDVVYNPVTRDYMGGLREDQFAFLEAYLATLDVATPLILAMHIPLFDSAPDRPSFRGLDRRRLFALLARFRQPLVLSAHSHVQQHVFHGAEQGWQGTAPLHEYNVGAACGGFWGGVADAAGIPDARMADGTPNGYATVEQDVKTGFRLRWYVARAAEDVAMHLYAPTVLRRGAWPGVPVVANVYMGLPESVVEVRIDDGPWRPMQRHEGADPWVLAENARDDAAATLRGFDRVPQARPSSHLWRFNLPTDLALGEHRIEVRSIDRWSGERRASAVYRLAEAP